jgi:hypothetical protein
VLLPCPPVIRTLASFLPLNRHLHPDSSGRESDALFFVHAHAWIVPLEEHAVHALRAEVRQKLFAYLPAGEGVFVGQGLLL